MKILGLEIRRATREPERVPPRLHVRRYDAAARGRRLDGWIAPSTSANAALTPVLQLLVNRARDLARNDTWARRANNLRVRHTVGRGILPKFAASSERKVRRARELWQAWAGPSMECSASGRKTFAAMQSQVMRAFGESGEVLIRRRRRRAADGLTVPLQLEVLEADYLDASKDQELADGGVIFQGVEFDPLGRRRGYWLLREHPGESRRLRAGGWESRFVPASEILHVYDEERAGQVRGVPAGVTAFVRLHDLGGYEDAHLLRQRIAACYTAFVTEPEGAGDDMAEDDEELLEKLQPGIIEYMPPGRDVKFADPPGVEGYGEYTAGQLHAIAAAWDVTYQDLTGDYAAANFSSSRLGRLAFGKDVEGWQSELLIPHLCAPVMRWFLEAAALAGESVDGIDVRWTPPRRELVEPQREVPAIVSEVRAGLKSHPEALRQLGYDPDEMVTEQAEWLAKIDALGLVFDTDARRSTTAGAPQAAAPDAKAEDDPQADEQAKKAPPAKAKK